MSKDNALIEFHKMFHDYLKHLATLCTGSILIVLAFLEKLATQPRGSWLVAVAICGFAIAIVASVVALTGNMDMVMEAYNDKPKYNYLDMTSYGLLGSWLFFLVGIISLVIFGVINL